MNPIKRLFGMAPTPDETAQAYLKEWIHDIPDHEVYLEKVGRERLERLVAGRECPERNPELDLAIGSGEGVL